jgi:nicotinate-nucleotide adenylyltransferase
VRIGVFGGSFNPLHKGHVSLASNVLQSGAVDEVWFIVSPHNPLKEKESLQDAQERLDNVRRGTQHINGVVVSDVEFTLPQPSYTYITLRKLKQMRPQDELVLIIGADNWQCFGNWKEHDEIASNYQIVIYPRRGYTIDTAKLPPNVRYLDMPLYDISSTQVRQMKSKGEDVSELLP